VSIAGSTSRVARFAALRRDPAYRRVAEVIAKRITDRRLAAGAQLPTELELAAQFGVTRSTVREALRELESAGLLGRRRGTKRSVVTRPSAAHVAARTSSALVLQDVTVHEVWEALTVIEPVTAALAALQRTDAHLRSIEAAAADFVAADSTGGPATTAQLAAVAAFFDAVETATGNRALVAAQRPLLPLLASSLRLVIDRVPQARARIALAQRRLCDAIGRRDREAAHLWMAKHIRDFRRGFEIAGISLSTRVELTAPPPKRRA